MDHILMNTLRVNLQGRAYDILVGPDLLHRTGEIYRWGVNITSNDRLVDKFGDEGDMWTGKEIRIKKVAEVVRGEEKFVLYAYPSVQTNLQPPATLDGERAWPLS